MTLTAPRSRQSPLFGDVRHLSRGHVVETRRRFGYQGDGLPTHFNPLCEGKLPTVDPCIALAPGLQQQ